MIILRRRQVELSHDAANVLFHGALADGEFVRYAHIRSPFGDERQDFTLPGSESGQRIRTAALGQNLLHQCGVDHSTAIGDAL